ncbi:hypothetical protein SKAU_G00392860 [Synaphobranchus kaupii]|uniref:Uncharacterized protein n=1 Tax=Synaphobranchus kaupii TaxID=118154 RepID=A0A9Q1EBS5_SYNKA|nr:hypothetical protein SKAU_G00392860 [Synaphobranchus kaupii]
MLADNVTTQLNSVYRSAFPSTYRRSNVRSFSPGPPTTRIDTVIVQTNLIFQNQAAVPDITTAATTLTQALTNSQVSLDIVSSTINAALPGSTSTTTASSAMATNKPQDMVIFLFPLILVINFLSTDMKRPQF